jgi:thioredoxin-related protein
MRLLSVAGLTFLFAFSFNWETDFDKAVDRAKKEHKLVLLKFSGSDWCIPCIKMQKEIFEADPFKKFADSSLVLVNADFPRLKKNKLSKDQQKKNDKLAEKYDKQGSFPFTLILTAKGEVLKSWEGYTKMTAEQFIAQIKPLLNAAN